MTAISLVDLPEVLLLFPGVPLALIGWGWWEWQGRYRYRAWREWRAGVRADRAGIAATKRAARGLWVASGRGKGAL